MRISGPTSSPANERQKRKFRVILEMGHQAVEQVLTLHDLDPDKELPVYAPEAQVVAYIEGYLCRADTTLTGLAYEWDLYPEVTALDITAIKEGS